MEKNLSPEKKNIGVFKQEKNRSKRAILSEDEVQRLIVALKE